jgi:hypothetical protein
MLIPEVVPPAPDLLELSEAALSSWGPFALLSFVEAAVQRSGELADLREEARRGAARLLSATLPRSDGIDRIALFSDCYRLVSRTLAAARWMTGQPAWWRRLCAVAQADLILDVLSGMDFDPAELRERFDVITPSAGAVAEALAVRTSPLWRAECTDPTWLHAEIIGRLTFLQRANPWLVDVEELRAAISETAKTCHDPLAPFAPGFLELDAPRLESMAPLPAYAETVREMLPQFAGGFATAAMWSFLSYAARHWRFDEETISLLSEAAKEIHPGDEEQDDRWAALRFAAHLAASQRATELADAVLSSVGAAAPMLTKPHPAVEVAVVAAAAWPEPDKHLDRLGTCLHRLAAAAPPAACDGLEALLDLIMGATSPNSWWRFSSARTLASLGALARRAPNPALSGN